MVRLIGVALVFTLLSCATEQKENESEQLKIVHIDTPCLAGGMPNLFTSSSHETYLSWIEYINDSTDALRFSKLQNDKWEPATSISAGSDWFVNWADYPSFTTYRNNPNHVAAHWLQKSAIGTYDYDVHIIQSIDNGKSWQNPFVIHRDSISAEHGFVSMIPIEENKIFATWLDGRNTKIEQTGKDNAHDNHGHHGSMTLRGAKFDIENNLYEEVEIDSKVCDCCQTSVAQTDLGLIVAYRDRTDEEIRDISIAREVNGKWITPTPVHNDNWLIAGCPVNGPMIKALDNLVVVAWYTQADHVAKINLAFSHDSGANFESPIRIDDGNPLGRVDLEISPDGQVLVTWLEDKDDTGSIRARIVHSGGKQSNSKELTQTEPTRNSGFPVLTKNKDEFIIAWTHVTDSTSIVKTASFKLDSF